MKRLIYVVLIFSFVSLLFGDEGVIRPTDQPNAIQRRMIDRQYGMFIHFGINTFHDQEWTDGTKPPLTFAPTSIDTDQWARTAKAAGMKYVIFTTKHHEGFCLWDSKQTEYDIASSSKPIDVVRQLAQSCKQYGIELGLYYSLWDRNWGDGVMRDRKPDRMPPDVARAYVDYMKAQLTELLSNYGDICELWLDGGWTQPREVWRIDEVYHLVKRLQPYCAVGVNWSIGLPDDPDARVIPEKQEEGYPIRYFPSDFRLGDPLLPKEPDPKLFSHEGKLYYLPFESTVCINKRWFFNTQDKEIKSVKAIAELYDRATAQDNILILNSPPNRDGVMSERNVQRLRELAEYLKSREKKISNTPR